MIGDQALVIRVSLRLPDLLDGNLALDFPYYVIELAQVLIQLVNCLANLEGEQLALALAHGLITTTSDFLGCLLDQSVQVLRNADGQEAFRVELDAVNIDEERIIDARLHLDAVLYEACLPRPVRSMDEDVASAGEQRSELENLGRLFPPSHVELVFEFHVDLCLLFSCLCLLLCELSLA